MNILKGSTPATKTYILKSNLSPSIKKGLAIYLYATNYSPLGTSQGFLTRNMPLPWQPASGFKIKVLLNLLLNYLKKSELSGGKSQVFGKKLYNYGNFLFIRIRCLPRLFFLCKENIPGQ